MRFKKISALALFALAVAVPAVLTRTASTQTVTEAPAGFDNLTNGFLPQGDPDNENEQPGTFVQAKRAFEERDEVDEGLGPVYNAQSCAECHQNPVTGGSSQITELRVGHLDASGAFVPAPGGSLLHARATDPRIQERVPDAPRIVFTSNNQIAVMGHDGGQSGAITFGVPQKGSPAFSPDGRKIAFQSLIGAKWDISVMNPDGSNQVRLTTNVNADDISPAWSPDGTKIAFASNRNGTYDIFVMNADGSNQVALNVTAGDEVQPAWSPDGTKIAFSKQNFSPNGIFRMESDGAGAIRLTNTAGIDDHPTFSSNGQTIAFARKSGSTGDIYTVPTVGGTQVQLTNDPALDEAPAWSPDGVTIAFASNRGGAGSHIFVMNADGGFQTKLSTLSVVDTLPAWSRDSGETVRTFRTSLSVMGDGFVEAIADSTLQSIAAGQPAGQQGTVVMVKVLESEGCPSNCAQAVGRFGWKSQHASLLSFSGDAYVNEMGITNFLFPNENTSLGRWIGYTSGFDPVPDQVACPDDPDRFCGEDQAKDIEEFTDFMRSLKVPPRDRDLVPDDATDPGSALFNSVGCAVCHVRTITTASPGSLVNGGTFFVPPALGNKIIHPFSDFLLHDIGTGDGIADGGTNGNKMRTPPLWGLRTRERLMHDGGGSSSPPTNSGSQTFAINEAIMRHAGQATNARSNYVILSAMQKRQLIKFLKSL
ncbi:MAG TPA: di-heme oxidoredictase family protein [Pyrinomonadaceae bacterium]